MDEAGAVADTGREVDLVQGKEATNRNDTKK
jgi:hypothetical protein